MANTPNLAHLSGAIHNKALDAVSKAKGFPKVSPAEAYDIMVESVKTTAKSMGAGDFTPLPFSEVEKLVRPIIADPIAALKQWLDDEKISLS